MALEYTFSMIKPDAVERNLTGKINSMLEDAGLKIVAQKMLHMSKNDAEKFYEVHKERPFYGELVQYMSSGPVVVQVLKGDNAVSLNRKIMGATNPAEADEGTIRKTHAIDIGKNSIHGSDSLENAHIEISFFFAKRELVD